jgi:DNA polymerase-1
MINLRNNFHIIESLSELPNLRNKKEIFCDVETKRIFDDKDLGGLYPWKGDRICGISVTFDDEENYWYVPIRHTAPNSNNLPIKNVMNWASDYLQSCKDWPNHNVKFDALMFDIGDNVTFNCRLVDTLTLSKLYYSDRFSYGLKPICKDWLDYDTGSTDKIKSYLDSIKSKSYADVPIDLLGEYACDDVRMNRKLYRFLQKKMQARIEETTGKQSEAVKKLIETEIKMTSILFDMEKEGIRIDETECKIETAKSLKIMIRNTTKIAELTGREFTNSNNCIYDIFVNQFELPILSTIREKKDGKWYDTGRPSFDKDAMALYKVHPLVTSNYKIKEVVNLISEYRTEQQFKSLFLDTFLKLNVNGVMHPNYNQSIRTGRLSCSKPNSQQQNDRSKKLIHPDENMGFVSNDYSQIEYRLIVHYAKIQAAIKAYNENPATDYHQWVADLLQIIRKPAKQLNFGMAYGAGKKLVTKSLTSNEHIIEIMGEKVNKLIEDGLLDPSLRVKKFNELCKKHAEESYKAYHNKMPEIKDTSQRAIDVASVRGFIFNIHGRRRYLPGRASYKAFNSLIQSDAADIMKERMVAISPRYNSDSRKWGIRLSANVHDELLNQVPIEVLYDPKLHEFICDTLENTNVKYRVPILTGLGISPNNWSEAAGDEMIKTNNGKFLAGKIR